VESDRPEEGCRVTARNLILDCLEHRVSYLPHKTHFLMAHDIFQAGDLTAVIGDNEGYEGHRAGYNGVHRLTHRTNPKSLFTVAGLNLEHIFDGHQDLQGDPAITFEPRRAPMTFTKISPTEAELHQPPTPTFKLESWTRLKLSAPHYIDMTFRCKAHQHVFTHGYIGLFWATYIDGPENKAIYFKDEKGWVQFCTQMHYDESTVLHVEDKTELKFTPGTRQMLYKNFSPLRFSLPLYYGLFGSHQYIIMFDRTNGIRFSHSPSGGGPPSATETAWDWQLIIPNYSLSQDYIHHARIIYRERCTRDEVLDEYKNWRAISPR
jgi:hypothetical protein